MAIPSHILLRGAGALRGKLTLLPGSVTTDNEHGIDILIRTYFGFLEDIYKLAPNKGDKDPWLPTMRATSRMFTEDKALTGTVRVEYKGLLQDKIPDLAVRGSWVEETAQLSVTQDQGDSSFGLILANGVGTAKVTYSLSDQELTQGTEVSITYRSPRTVFMYVTRKKPRKPKYNNTLLQSVADFSITEMRPARVFGRPLAIVVVRCKGFDVEPVGSYWQVTETQQALLIPYDARQMFQPFGMPLVYNGRLRTV